VSELCELPALRDERLLHEYARAIIQPEMCAGEIDFTPVVAPKWGMLGAPSLGQGGNSSKIEVCGAVVVMRLALCALCVIVLLIILMYQPDAALQPLPTPRAHPHTPSHRHICGVAHGGCALEG
jgi:hypothetical protein